MNAPVPRPAVLDDDLALNLDERRVLDLYRRPESSGLGRAIRLSIQYAGGAAIFVIVAVTSGNPWWSLAVWLVLAAVLIVRLVNARTIVGAMPSVIEKYERQITRLRDAMPQTAPPDDANE